MCVSVPYHVFLILILGITDGTATGGLAQGPGPPTRGVCEFCHLRHAGSVCAVSAGAAVRTGLTVTREVAGEGGKLLVK